MSDYILRVGQEGADRLRILARVLQPTTRGLLRRAGLGPGMRCLDVGCGPGEVTCLMARRVGRQGLAVGIDVNEGYLELARQKAAERNLSAVFRCAGAHDFKDEPANDLVYARFLLTHVPGPEDVVARMARATRAGGVVVVEDLDFPGHFSYPPCPALGRYVELFRQLLRRKGGDPDIGPRLPGMLEDVGLEPVRFRVVLPTFRRGPGKRIAALTLDHVREGVIAAALASAAEVDAIIQELDTFAADPRTLMSFPRIFQVWGRRK